MTDVPDSVAAQRAQSFAHVPGVYDRARPGYPREAAAWLAGADRARVLELGAGTGKLTGELLALGHDVMATDPADEMLAVLRASHPQARTSVAKAESIPFASRSADVVVAAQAFHWFDPATALPEIFRVLRPQGTLSLVWNAADVRVPWVKKLGRIVGDGSLTGDDKDPSAVIAASGLFDTVERVVFRHWVTVGQQRLRDLVASHSAVSTLEPRELDKVLAAVDALYADYQRGSAGMQLPYLTHCYRATAFPVVVHQASEDTMTMDAAAATEADEGTQLISFS